MAVVKRYNTNKLFFSDRLSLKLESIYSNAITVVEAPTGFGKTTSVRNVLGKSDDVVVWITVENENRKDFFEELCGQLQNIDSELAKNIRNIGYPEDYDSINKIVNLFDEMDFSENYIIVLDNFQYVKDENIVLALIKCVEVSEEQLRLVFLTQNIRFESLMDLMAKEELNYIGKNDLEFNREEIRMYFRECGIYLTDYEADYLFKYTEGWISAIYLQMLHYISDNKFEADAGIDKLVCMAIWDKLSFEEQDFLISISIYDSFSVKQACFVGAGELEQSHIKNLLGSNSFIRYDSKERKYFMHAILRFFLKAEFDKMDIIEKKKVYERAAKWYEDNENYYQALKCYYYIKKYDEIYDLSFAMEDLLSYLNRENKEMFIKIPSMVSYETKERNIRQSIIFAYILFMYHEKDFFNNECALISEMIDNSQYMREREKNMLKGEIIFCSSFSNYNNVDKMLEGFYEAYEYMHSPSTIYSNKLDLTFFNPSVLSCFYSEKGRLMEKLDQFEKLMIIYYKMTSGNGKGLEAVMRAEILYYQGNYEDAQILCQKALYMAETRGQINVYVCAMFIMAKIAMFEGDYENMKHIIQSIRSKITGSEERNHVLMADMCEGFVYMMIDKCDKMPGWLRDEKSIEEKSTVFTLSFSNIIYAKYLIVNEQYTKFLGISGQLLGAAKIFSNRMCEIYLYIYIAAANYRIGNKIKAAKFINEAIELSYEDDLTMPFVENYPYVSEIFIPDTESDAYIDFINEVRLVYKRHEREFKSVVNNYREDVDYGLTNRELQIARLAARRYTNNEIAEQLYIAVGTVKSNLKTIFAKLNIKSRSELKNYFKE